MSIILSATNLPDEKLNEAFHILFGREWKQKWSVKDTAYEMRNIINGSTSPCISFENWVSCINFLYASIENGIDRGNTPISEQTKTAIDFAIDDTQLHLDNVLENIKLKSVERDVLYKQIATLNSIKSK